MDAYKTYLEIRGRSESFRASKCIFNSYEMKFLSVEKF